MLLIRKKSGLPLYRAETDGDVWILFANGDPNDPYPAQSGFATDNDRDRGKDCSGSTTYACYDSFLEMCVDCDNES